MPGGDRDRPPFERARCHDQTRGCGNGSDPVDILATLMRRRRVKRVPVLRDSKLVGIVSRADVLEALVRNSATADERGLSQHAPE
jgi:CBS domain-containing protein